VQQNSPWFIAYVLQGPIGKWNLERYVYGAAQPRLNLPHVGAFEIPVPPISEQKAIAEYLTIALKKFDGTSARAIAEIALLREYRDRLVADVVTGKLDVREVAARLSEEADKVTADVESDLSSEREPADEDSAG
jgi:type I restriction enzyme S subunit